MAWFERFDENWESLRTKYGDTFYRTWKLYLQGCAAAFRVGKLRVWQFVFSKGGRAVTVSATPIRSIDGLPDTCRRLPPSWRIFLSGQQQAALRLEWKSSFFVETGVKLGVNRNQPQGRRLRRVLAGG
jgi:hypothetical protein